VNVLHNYLYSSLKLFSDLYLAKFLARYKFLDTAAKLFFPCNVKLTHFEVLQCYIANVLICIVGLEDFISGIANWIVTAFDLRYHVQIFDSSCWFLRLESLRFCKAIHFCIFNIFVDYANYKFNVIKFSILLLKQQSYS